MAAAANYRLLGRFRDAVVMYQLALKFERRPEIYLNLGLTELEAGNRSAAMRYLVMAGQFDPHILTYSVPAPDVLEEVRRLIADQGKSRPDDH